MHTDIKPIYKPIQPGIKQSAENVSYAEVMPCDELKKVIYCYWQLKTSETLSSPFMYRVVADGCIDIFFELNKPHENFVMGFCKTFTEFPLENSFNYAGIRFLPTMFPQLFKINASELSNRFEQLQNVLPETADFISNRFSSSHRLDQVKEIFDAYFLALLKKADFNEDSRLYHALDIIITNFGVVDIKKDLDTGISERQLRRLFEFYIGTTAKTFSQVVRFQTILGAKPSSQSLAQNKLFFDHGYYDQSHFIKEFKNFYGVTPSVAFGR